jgi:putative transposase
MPQSFDSINVHIVFSTLRREPLIDSAWQSRLYEYFGGIVRERKASLISAGRIPDHVHLLVSLGRELAVAEAVRIVKCVSSRWINETLSEPRDFAWQAGYGAFSVSSSQLDKVQQYIANQEVHHRSRTFQEELRELLTRHQIPFDERYMWE